MAAQDEQKRFVMQSSRMAIEAGLSHILRQVTTLEEAIWKEPGLAFDLAKVLVESVCKSLLTNIGISFAHDEDLPKLYKLVTTNMPLLPMGASSEIAARESVKKALGGMASALVAICELRNAYGFASHGSASERTAMESAEALLAAQAADAIVGFLYANHIRDRQPAAPVPAYGDYPDFNSHVDYENSLVSIFDLEYLPSEVLFYVDRAAYDDRLVGFNSAVIEHMESGEEGEDNLG
jgi:Abortive infection C-terminus